MLARSTPSAVTAVFPSHSSSLGFPGKGARPGSSSGSTGISRGDIIETLSAPVRTGPRPAGRYRNSPGERHPSAGRLRADVMQHSMKFLDALVADHGELSLEKPRHLRVRASAEVTGHVIMIGLNPFGHIFIGCWVLNPLRAAPRVSPLHLGLGGLLAPGSRNRDGLPRFVAVEDQDLVRISLEASRQGETRYRPELHFVDIVTLPTCPSHALADNQEGDYSRPAEHWWRQIRMVPLELLQNLTNLTLPDCGGARRRRQRSGDRG